MKRFPILFSLIGLISLSVLFTTARAYSPREATNSPGSKCATVGLVAKSGTGHVKCMRNGKKLVWRKIVKPTTVRVSPSASAKRTPSQSPTAVSLVIPTAQNEYTVNARGTTWSWSFSYQLDGSKSALLSDSSHSTVLFLPQGKPVHILLKSNDVSHGFWVPGLGIDKEASPDSLTRIDITAEKTGVFPGACNIQCGRGHTGMKLSIEVVPETEYLKYLATLK